MFAYNGAGRTERVMTSEQAAGMGAGGADPGGDIYVHVNAPVFGVDHLEDTIQGVIRRGIRSRQVAAAIVARRR